MMAVIILLCIVELCSVAQKISPLFTAILLTLAYFDHFKGQLSLLIFHNFLSVWE